jgi:hypothetical protein
MHVHVLRIRLLCGKSSTGTCAICELREKQIVFGAAPLGGTVHTLTNFDVAECWLPLPHITHRLGCQGEIPSDVRLGSPIHLEQRCIAATPTP